jgi:hypothetical protein
MTIEGAFLSPFGLQKLEQARARGDWGEYVGRMAALVCLIDARPWGIRGAPEYQWPEGTIRSPRAELVRACLEWCRRGLMPKEEHVLAVRVLVSVALPHARRLVIVRAPNPTELDVRALLAECLAQLHIQAFLEWEKTRIGRDTGPRLLEWAIRALRFLRRDTEYVEALQFLYLESGDTLVRQAQLSAARRRFLKKPDPKRASLAAGLLLPNSDLRKDFVHSEVRIEPLSACPEKLRVPYIAVEHDKYYQSLLLQKKKDVRLP